MNAESSNPEDGELFLAWSSDEVVVLAEVADGQWVVSRAWRRDDRLGDVRRWRFDSPDLAAGQLRRLVRDVARDDKQASDVANRFSEWASGRS